MMLSLTAGPPTRGLPKYVAVYQPSRTPKTHLVCPSSRYKAVRVYDTHDQVKAYCGRWVPTNDNSFYWHNDTVRPSQRRQQLAIIREKGWQDGYCAHCLSRAEKLADDPNYMEPELNQYMTEFYKIWASETQ